MQTFGQKNNLIRNGGRVPQSVVIEGINRQRQNVPKSVVTNNHVKFPQQQHHNDINASENMSFDNHDHQPQQNNQINGNESNLMNLNSQRTNKIVNNSFKDNTNPNTARSVKDNTNPNTARSVVIGNNQNQIQKNDQNETYSGQLPDCPCFFHPTQTISNYCKIQNLPLCPECVRVQGQKLQNQHVPIQFESFSQVWQETRSHLQNELNCINNQISGLKQCNQDTHFQNEQMMQDLDDAEEKLKQKISEVFTDIKSDILNLQKQQSKYFNLDQHYNASFLGLNQELKVANDKLNKNIQQMYEPDRALKTVVKSRSQKEDSKIFIQEYLKLIMKSKHEIQSMYQHHYSLDLNKVGLQNLKSQISAVLLTKKMNPLQSNLDIINKNFEAKFSQLMMFHQKKNIDEYWKNRGLMPVKHII